MIRLGMIGRSSITARMLKAMEVVPEVRPTAFYSRTQADAKVFAAANGSTLAFSNLEELAACPEIDAVYIASPNCCHYPQAAMMLKAGKHVLGEKPACSNAEQVRKLLTLSRECGKIYMEAMRPVYDDALELIRQHLPEIGPLRQVRMDYNQISSRYEQYLKEGNAVNIFNPALSNAALLDMGCYTVHSIVHLFGKPESIHACSVHLDNGYEVLGSVLMGYPGFTAEGSYSKIHANAVPSSFVGEKGAILMDNVNDTTRIWMRMNDGSETDLGYQVKQPGTMVCELRAFHEFVTTNTRPEKQNATSLLVAEVLDEARRQTGTRFPDDTDGFMSK